MRYLQFLSQMHEIVDPGTYLEIGLRNGNSMSLARCPAIGIDPDFTVTAELVAPVWMFRTTSDEYFERPEPLAPFDGRAIDFAFIDGLHLFEFALRDFMYVERNSAPWTVAVLDDIFPRNVDEAARNRHTNAWTGDVFKIIQVLRERRPDLTLTLVNTMPTGLLMISGLDSKNTVLTDQYDDIIESTVKPDPQDVPAEILERHGVITPEEALSLDFLKKLREQRPGGGPEAEKRIAIVPRRPLAGPVDVVRHPAGGTPAASAKKTAPATKTASTAAKKTTVPGSGKMPAKKKKKSFASRVRRKVLGAPKK